MDSSQLIDDTEIHQLTSTTFSVNLVNNIRREFEIPWAVWLVGFFVMG